MEQLIKPISEKYEEYLIDESKYKGYADSISFPENEEEICRILKETREKRIMITIQGGKTGITGGAVPFGGHILNLSHMKKVKGNTLFADGTGQITVEAGITLMDLRAQINRIFRVTPLFWPPDPTETSASIGGIAASGAQGISRLLYGSAKNYIVGLRMVTEDGSVVEMREGECIQLFSGRDMNMLDTVLGREGITGVITEVTLRLIPKPESMWGIAFFFENIKDAGNFIDMQREKPSVSADAKIAAAEYVDRIALDLIESHKETMTKIKELPDVQESYAAMVYLELHGTEEGNEKLAEMLMEVAMVCGNDPDKAWAVSGDAEIEKMQAFRHAAAETANLFIEEVRRKECRITKLGTDMIPANVKFTWLIQKIRQELQEEGLKGCVFGHAMDNHIHVNLLPEDYEQYVKGKELLQRWAQEVVKEDGSIVKEHGIGKLKRSMFAGLISHSYLSLCRDLKREFDPSCRVNRGNILTMEEGEL